MKLQDTIIPDVGSEEPIPTDQIAGRNITIIDSDTIQKKSGGSFTIWTILMDGLLYKTYAPNNGWAKTKVRVWMQEHAGEELQCTLITITTGKGYVLYDLAGWHEEGEETVTVELEPAENQVPF